MHLNIQRYVSSRLLEDLEQIYMGMEQKIYNKIIDYLNVPQ